MNPSTHMSRLFDLTGRTALVTGGAGYLGRAIAEAMAELGASVVLTSRDAPRASAAVAALESKGAARHVGVALDHRDPPGLDRAFAGAIDAAGGRIDILVNNAHDRTTDDWRSVTPADFSRDLENCTACFTLARLMHDHAVAQRRPASIVMLGSMYGVVGSYPPVYEGIGPASPVSYHATKGAIVQLTRHLAVYWAKDGVRVNCLCPGPFPFPDANPLLIERLNQRVPMGRVGQSWEIKGAAAFLASDASSYMTGQVLLIDGGWTAW